MNTTHYSSLSLIALMASMSLGIALADSTDDALNQFYSENMMSNLSSQGAGEVITNPPPGEKAEERHKGSHPHKDPAPHQSAGVSNRSSQTFFSYHPSAAVTGKAHVNFLTAVAGGDPKKAAWVQKELTGNSAENRFDARFSQYGFSSRDASDSYAGFVIVLWEIANNQSASAHPAGIRQIRQKVNELLLIKFGSKTITDETKQYYSEYFKLLAVVFNDKWKEDRTKNDVAGLQKVQDTAYQSGKKLGIDLRRLQLTDNGFKKI
jgi:hypothetical protein